MIIFILGFILGWFIGIIMVTYNFITKINNSEDLDELRLRMNLK